MPPAFPIKILEQGDIADLWNLVNEGRHQTEAAYFERALEEQQEGKRLVFVAREAGREEISGKVVGYVHYNRFPKYAPFRRFGLPEIQDLYVHPDYRRQGIGRVMLDACETQARADGHGEIGIGVGVMSGFGAAQRLYARSGFIPDGAGVTYDRDPVTTGELRALDDHLCLMMTKTL